MWDSFAPMGGRRATQFGIAITSLLFSMMSAPAEPSGWIVSEVARGDSWVSPYWGYCAPKIATDGTAYYTVGLWGNSPETSHGVVYKRQDGVWSKGAELPGIYQPPVIMLDSSGRVLVIYNQWEKPILILRGRNPGSIDAFDTLPPHPDMPNAFYPGAAIRGDTLYFAFCSTPSYSMYLSSLDLRTLTWSPLITMQEGQIESKPKTAWTYPILLPDANGVHVVASNCPDGGDENSYNIVWYLYYRRGELTPAIQERVAESPVGNTAYATDMSVDSEGQIHVLHMFNVHNYGEPLPADADPAGTYHSWRPADGAWQRERIAPATIASFNKDDKTLTAVLTVNGILQRLPLNGNAEPRPLVAPEQLPGAPGFVDVLSQSSGSNYSKGMALVTDALPLPSEKPTSRVLLAVLPLNPVGENTLINGDFAQWDSYKGGGVTTTTVGVPSGSIPNHWYGGPGVGATATYDVIMRTESDPREMPARYLRVSWSTPPENWGEDHHKGVQRYTFLEYFGIQDVHRFAGKSVLLRFKARCSEDGVDLIPIMWHSYDAETPGIVAVKGKGYELFESSGVAGMVAVAQGAPNPLAGSKMKTEWQTFEKILSLPATDGKSITKGHYTGVGFDLTVGKRITVDLAEVELYELRS
ncbi:MAG: hypothetical protein IT366_17430 [Candidatus Hydrogenedentes bacterium]|nr:hypothetical protein [Candidatus Hydrogenedentota bacterium]